VAWNLQGEKENDSVKARCPIIYNLAGDLRCEKEKNLNLGGRMGDSLCWEEKGKFRPVF